VGVFVRPQQRCGRADEDGNVDLGDLGGQQRVARRLFDADVAGDNRQAEHAHVGRGERHQDRDGVVRSGVGVDEQIAHGFGRWRMEGTHGTRRAALPSTSDPNSAPGGPPILSTSIRSPRFLRHAQSLPRLLDCDVTHRPTASS